MARVRIETEHGSQVEIYEINNQDSFDGDVLLILFKAVSAVLGANKSELDRLKDKLNVVADAIRSLDFEYE